MLVLDGLTKRFGGVVAVNGCSLAVRRARMTGLIGPNGSGKTTLFNLISGLLPPDAGKVRFAGERIDGLPPHQISARGIGRTFQITRIFRRMTCSENLLVGGRRLAAAERAERARELLGRFRLDRFCDEPADHLSYGQQKLLELARALMGRPALLLLDEPAAGLNPTLREEILEHLRALQRDGITIFIIEHDMRFLMGACEHVVALDHGEKVVEGSAERVRNDPRVMEAYFGR